MAIRVFYGEGHGKSTAALGQAVFKATEGENSVIIRFLKGKLTSKDEYLTRLEPEIKLVCFEKDEGRYEDLSPDEKKEAERNIKNGVGYAKKVLSTGECSLVILDEFLGLLELGLLDISELAEMLKNKASGVDVILTGRNLSESLREYVDEIYKIKSEK